MTHWQAILKQTTDRDFMRRLWRLALPVSLQSMMFSLLGLIDIMMVSQLGTTEVAAVGLGNRIFFFNLLVIAGLCGGVSVLAAQYFGRGDLAGVRRSLALALLGAMLVTLPFALLYLTHPEWIIRHATNDPRLIPLAVQYLLITGGSVLCTAIVVPLESALRAVGQAAAPTRIGLVAILANVLLNYALIFGHWGFEAMGVAGSAWGTTLSRCLQTVLLLVYLWRARRDLLPTRADWHRALTRVETRRFALIALPLLLHDGLWAFGMMLYGFLYAHLGVDELAIMTTLGALEGILISLFFGLAVACATLLGHQLGAQEYQRAWQHSQLFLLLAPFGALLVGAVVWLLQAPLLGAIGNLHSDPGSLASQVLAIVCIGMLVKVFNMVGIVGVLRSGGDVNYTIFIDIVSMWCIGLPLAALTVWLGWPLPAVVALVLLEEIAKCLLVLRRIGRRRWLRNLILE
ncbi:MATE family efflux transporter [Aeromonas schubertii]|uniref:MATE family efflux transporter n=1 Tax=Aeromonas schubertii TaxID=652 RepID=UPI00067F351A|nr:MATE family efflux transporter [Aeromonas schubertii]KUE80274.1 MATE family efflux transporter [Aeromonas schubertii]